LCFCMIDDGAVMLSGSHARICTLCRNLFVPT
jgi:hypothetical protein